MKLALHIVDFKWSGGPNGFATKLPEIARAAEAAGFDSIALADHFWLSRWMGGPEGDMLEAYSTLGFLAAHTRRVKLFAMVTGAPYRHPTILAKTVTTLDVLSGGRAWLGIGAGDFPVEEARGQGIANPPLATRYELLEETLQICLRMWSGERGDERPFAGRHYQLDRPLNLPQSLSRPHPPILVAGIGEQKTLRLVARYADACSLRPGPDIPHKLDVLRRHCDAEGRDYDAIAKTCAFAFDVGEDGTDSAKIGELVGQLRWLAGMGIQTVIGRVSHSDRIAPLEAIGREVISAVAEL